MKTTLLFVAAVSAASPVFAASACVSAPYSTYMAGGFQCEIAGTLFSSFSFFLQNSTSPTVPLTPSQIVVTPLDQPGQVGLRFSGMFEAEGGPNGPGPAEGLLNISYRFIYNLSRPAGNFTAVGAILNSPVRSSPNPLKFGAVQGFNLAANDAALATVSDTSPSNFTVLNFRRLTIAADDLISLTGGASAAGTVSPVGFVSLASADMLFQYQPVPEPTSTMLVVSGIGLVGAIKAFRRRRRCECLAPAQSGKCGDCRACLDA